MKTLKTLLTISLSLLVINAFATIVNVNNDTPSPGEYSDLQTAIDAVSAGDTIYLAPTLVNYGTVTLTKQLSFFGPGYVVSSGILGAHAIVEDILITDALAAGSQFIGFRFNELNINLPVSGTISGLVVQRCIIDSRIYTSNDQFQNGLIEGNVFLSASYCLFGTFAGSFLMSTISNNIINGWVYNMDNCEFSNNLVLGLSGGSSSLFYGVTNTSTIDNIVIGRACNSSGLTNFYAGNISYDGSNNTFPNGTNLENVDPQFVNGPVGYFLFSYDYTLDAGSPGIGAGSGGSDIGVYAGNGVYRKDGEPAIPIIRQVNVPGGTTVPANATFTINIISEAHE